MPAAPVQILVLEIQQDISDLSATYSSWASSGASAALENIGKIRLGPAKAYRAHNRLAAAKEVFTAAQPVYRESGQWRIAHSARRTHSRYVQLCRTECADVDLGEPGEIAGTGAESWFGGGKVHIADRDLTVRPAVISRVAARQIRVFEPSGLIAPPEAEDLGSQLSSGALVAGHRLRLDPRRISSSWNIWPTNSCPAWCRRGGFGQRPEIVDTCSACAGRVGRVLLESLENTADCYFVVNKRSLCVRFPKMGAP